MLQEQNSKSKERLRLEEQRAKYEQKLREQIKKDERRQREREKSLKLLIGELFTKHLPDYMLYEEAEMERIVAAAMGSDACRDAIESIKAEAGNATGTSSDGTQKPSRSGTSKSDDVKSIADASVMENDDDSEDKAADVSIDTSNDASNDEDSEESYDSSDDDSSEEEYEEDFSDEESDEE